MKLGGAGGPAARETCITFSGEWPQRPLKRRPRDSAGGMAGGGKATTAAMADGVRDDAFSPAPLARTRARLRAPPANLPRLTKGHRARRGTGRGQCAIGADARLARGRRSGRLSAGASAPVAPGAPDAPVAPDAPDAPDAPSAPRRPSEAPRRRGPRGRASGPRGLSPIG